MKKVLIVDTIGIPRLGEEKVEGTEVVIENHLNNVFHMLTSEYDFNGIAWDKENPRAPTPVQAPHFQRARDRREAELKTRRPYWDAILFYLQSHGGMDLCTALGCAALASASGCKYIRIFEFTSTSFYWFSFADASEMSLRFDMNGIKVDVLRHWPEMGTRQLEHWIELIQHLLLRRAGYDACLRGGTHTWPHREGLKSIPAKEFFDGIWPGLFQEKAE